MEKTLDFSLKICYTYSIKKKQNAMLDIATEEKMKKIIITRHEAFVPFLKTLGVITPNEEFEVIDHITSNDVIANKNVITSGLPLHLCAMAHKVTIVTLNIPFEKRGKELSIKNMESFFKGVKTFEVKEV